MTGDVIRRAVVRARAHEGQAERDVDAVLHAQEAGRKYVTIASRVGASATITAGLKPGERVATSAIAELKAVLGGE